MVCRCRWRRLHEIQVHEPVLIVVEPGNAGAHGFEIILFVGGSAVLKESDSGGLSDVGVADGNAVVCCFRRLDCEGYRGEGRSDYHDQRQTTRPPAPKPDSLLVFDFFRILVWFPVGS